MSNPVLAKIGEVLTQHVANGGSCCFNKVTVQANDIRIEHKDVDGTTTEHRISVEPTGKCSGGKDVPDCCANQKYSQDDCKLAS